MRRWKLILTLLWFTGLFDAAYPQASTSTITGTVHDSTNAVFPGARLTLSNTSTNVAVSTTTSPVGVYLFPVIIPGPYVLEATAPGMAKYEGWDGVSRLVRRHSSPAEPVRTVAGAVDFEFVVIQNQQPATAAIGEHAGPAVYLPERNRGAQHAILVEAIVVDQAGAGRPSRTSLG
jgi:hypothetical protein